MAKLGGEVLYVASGPALTICQIIPSLFPAYRDLGIFEMGHFPENPYGAIQDRESQSSTRPFAQAHFQIEDRLQSQICQGFTMGLLFRKMRGKGIVFYSFFELISQ